LKGIDTGLMEEPPIRILVQGTNEWRYENEWPLARTRWTKLYLRSGFQLSEIPPSDGEEPDRFSNKPGLRPGEPVPCLKYLTEPLTRELEITGPIALYLQASISTTDADWIVEIRDVNPAGEEKLVTMGWLKASHREIDEDKSKPYRPHHPHTRSVPIEPGAVCEYPIEIRDTSMVFRQGHRIELVIKGQDAPWEGKEYFRDVFWHLPSSTETNRAVYHDARHPSYLLVPVIPR